MFFYWEFYHVILYVRSSNRLPRVFFNRIHLKLFNLPKKKKERKKKRYNKGSQRAVPALKNEQPLTPLLLLGTPLLMGGGATHSLFLFLFSSSSSSIFLFLFFFVKKKLF
jgi:hypothetical protein